MTEFIQLKDEVKHLKNLFKEVIDDLEKVKAETEQLSELVNTMHVRDSKFRKDMAQKFEESANDPPRIMELAMELREGFSKEY